MRKAFSIGAEQSVS